MEALPGVAEVSVRAPAVTQAVMRGVIAAVRNCNQKTSWRKKKTVFIIYMLKLFESPLKSWVSSPLLCGGIKVPYESNCAAFLNIFRQPVFMPHSTLKLCKFREVGLES